MQIKVATYNILSYPFANLLSKEMKDDKPVYTSIQLDPIRRAQLILNKLTTIINSNPDIIICLQEVAATWVDMLKPFFTNYEYIIMNVQYGSKFTGNMGVLVAYPKKFTILKYDVSTPMQFINYKQQSQYPQFENLCIQDTIAWACRKPNAAILLQFKYNTYKFGIVTYHMPCEYKCPSLMYIISNELCNKVINFMESQPFVFAGDFNIVPDSDLYKNIITKFSCAWTSINQNKTYPITNHSYINGKEFIGCIDYIFYNGLKCKSIICDDAKSIQPNDIEPSDHVPVIATFDL